MLSHHSLKDDFLEESSDRDVALRVEVQLVLHRLLFLQVHIEHPVFHLQVQCHLYLEVNDVSRLVGL